MYLKIADANSALVARSLVSKSSHCIPAQKDSMGLYPVAETAGGVSPVGWISDEALVVINTALDDYEVVWGAAGHPHAVFPTTFTELSRAAGAQPMIVGD